MSNITLQAKKSVAESDGRHTTEELYSTNKALHTTAVSSTGVAQGSVVTVLDAQTGDVTGAAVPFGMQSGIVHATIDTTGAKTCTISLYGSINSDKSDPQLLFTFAMETTATGTDTEFGFITAQWPYVYGVISATAGAGTLDSADLDVAV